MVAFKGIANKQTLLLKRSKQEDLHYLSFTHCVVKEASHANFRLQHPSMQICLLLSLTSPLQKPMRRKGSIFHSSWSVLTGGSKTLPRSSIDKSSIAELQLVLCKHCPLANYSWETVESKLYQHIFINTLSKFRFQFSLKHVKCVSLNCDA